jgi:antitoxin HicB
MVYPVTLTRDDNNTWLVTFPDFPEAHTFGDDVNDALAHAADALETIVDSYIRDRRPIPAPGPNKRGRRAVPLTLLVEMKVGLYQALRQSKTSKAELARRLNCHVPQVDRLFDIRHHSRLDQIEAAATALGKRINVRLEPKIA